MTTVSIEQAQAELPQLLEQLANGDEVVITQDEKPVGKLVSLSDRRKRPIFGRGVGKVVIHSWDDDHLEDFKDYMPTDEEMEKLRPGTRPDETALD